MKKQRISKIFDTLETLGEIPKRALSDTLKTFNPLEILNSATTPSSETADSTEQQKPQDHTPLNLDKVKGKHDVEDLSKKKEDADQKRINAVRNRLFQQVRGEQDYAIKSAAQQEKQEKEQELTEERQRQEEIKRRLAASQNTDAPEGKTGRGGLFAKKKRRTKLAAQENQPEMKGSGKH